MVMDKDTGGPAFPHTYFDVQLSKTRVMEGMTLRDYFAAKVMQGFCAGLQAGDNVDALPELAYAMADAMLAERKK